MHITCVLVNDIKGSSRFCEYMYMYKCTCKFIMLLRSLVDSISTCTCVLVHCEESSRFYKYMYITCVVANDIEGSSEYMHMCTCKL